MIVAALEAAFTTLGPEYLSRCWAQRTSWLGFEFDSTLGYPGEGPPAENFITEEMERWLDELEEEKWLLEQLPVVQKIDFLYGEAANANKVQATLLCCWAGERFKRIKEQCTDDGKKPTFLEAIRALRETINESTAAQATPIILARWPAVMSSLEKVRNAPWRQLRQQASSIYIARYSGSLATA
eukprot:CAMPEP_0184393462 /NCGR_PEP_ID=MMETSP0007-20130409/34740_1 /TAXON_ID=97485 /ORGANISM="Prymnesium parvum, Strain Texoma1" /LENGTH=183 /DNA_ID=CAMNT_0026744459 /DNA_START=214 /DNA_END=766 /DNA_ORIENTATION=-